MKISSRINRKFMFKMLFKWRKNKNKSITTNHIKSIIFGRKISVLLETKQQNKTIQKLMYVFKIKIIFINV